MSDITTQAVATEALELQKNIDELSAKLDTVKETIRGIANGNKLDIVVEGLGKINVSAPRIGSEKVVLSLNVEKISKLPELKSKLIESGVAVEEIKKTSPAKASVTITPNV